MGASILKYKLKPAPSDWLIGTGEMADLIRVFDWSKTPLGPREDWPPALRVSVNNVINSSFPMSVLWGENFLLVYNDAYRVIAGHRHPAALGQPTSVIWPEIWPKIKPLLEQVAKYHKPVFLEDQSFPIQSGTSGLRDAWFTLSYSPIYLEDGQMGGLQVVLLETTKRKLAEESLRRSEATVRSIFRTAPTGIGVMTNEVIAEVNDCILLMTGYTRDELIGENLRMLYPSQEDYDQSRWHGAGTVETRWICKNGTVINILYSLTPVDPENPQSPVTFTALDITEKKAIEEALKETEERIRILSGNIPDTMIYQIRFALDGKRHFTYVSPVVEQLHGVTADEALADVTKLYDQVIEEDRTKLAEAEDLALSTLTNLKIEARFRTPQGAVCWRLFKSTPRRLPDGSVLWDGVEYDVTERKLLEKELRDAIELRDEFMSIVSHELKTPLTALSVQLQLLNRLNSTQGAGTNPKVTALAKGALASTESLIGLLDALLDVTRIRAGKLTLQKTKMDLRAAVLDVCSEMQESAKQKGSSVTIDAKEPALGVWDPIRIKQVLSNLLSNAIKYGEGKPIEVSLFNDSKGVILKIRDHGIGISKEMQSKIFERFQRAAQDKNITGLGLGLFVARQIVEAHGGSIRVESEPGMGAEFSVQLPY